MSVDVDCSKISHQHGDNPSLSTVITMVGLIDEALEEKKNTNRVNEIKLT